ncbi:hypothetical protein [Cellulosilyticum ruminicola]|uniref:hypothetical protein n=1 Tax=Cellulosilyticum ruminicola TaxID=425254 RepID=UPI0012ED2B4E|nr:hypothetical protein [Cellulosilyticum ruminicola]
MKEKETKVQANSSLLDRMIQRQMSNRLQNMHEKIIAKAIKSLLMKDDNKYMN